MPKFSPAAVALAALLAACGQKPAQKKDAAPASAPAPAPASQSGPATAPVSVASEKPLTLPPPSPVVTRPLPEGAPLPASYTLLADTLLPQNRLVNVEIKDEPKTTLDTLSAAFLAAGFSESSPRRALPDATVTYGETIGFQKNGWSVVVTALAGPKNLISYNFTQAKP